MLCLCEGQGHGGESALSSQAQPGQREQHGSVLEHLCLSSVSGFTCAVSVSATLSLGATRHDIQYSSAGTQPTCGFSPVAVVRKCGSIFYLENFGQMMSCCVMGYYKTIIFSLNRLLYECRWKVVVINQHRKMWCSNY